MANTVIDVAVRTKGSNELDKLQKRMLQLERQVATLQGQLPKASNNVRKFGASAAAASGGVRTLGAAVQAALGPLALAGGAVGALTSAFQTLSTQDFAEAKVRTLGVNSKDLVKELKAVSAELKGQASVVELTGAAYDVASAGFNNAADAARVLKAASLGATGGFSDINTVANAATSVLNAYGLSASQAGLLVDQFVQTQNDGKIVVAEYAAEIGKVASVAAGLKIPLSEVNAVIAQATASGVKSEVAFTGLKTALAQLASGQATERMKELGISIDANTIASDGLIGTFKKIKDSGADMGQVLKLLGTEAGPALAPVLNNLERFEELLENQKGAAGASAAAQKEAADTIQGAWKALQTAVQNFFSDQSALGDLLKVTLQVLAYSLETTAKALNIMLTPIKAIYDVVKGLAGAIDDAFNVSDTIERANTAARTFQGELGTIKDEFLVELGQAFSPVVDKWNEGMTALSQFWGQTTQAMGEMATGFGEWVGGVWNSIAQGAQGIIAPIQNAFTAAFQGAMQIIENFWNSLPNWLKSALSAASSVAGAVFGAVGNALGKIKGAAASALKGGQGAVGGGAAAGAAPTGGGGGGTGGQGAGGSKGKATKDNLQDRIRESEQLLEVLALQLKIEEEQNPIKKIGLKLDLDKLQANHEYEDILGKETNEIVKQNAEKAKGLKIDKAKAEANKKAADLGEKLGSDMARMMMNQKKQNKELTESDKLWNGIYTTVTSELSGAIQGLIQGTATLNDIAGQLLTKLGGLFLDAAFAGLGKSLKIPGFADGGYPPVGKPSVVGERGPELFIPGQAGLIVPSDIFEATRSAIGAESKAPTAFDDNREAINSVTTLNRERQVERLLTSGASSTEIRYSRVGTGDLPFVTEDNMLQATRAAAQEGARLGQARTLAALKNNPGARRSIGI